MTPAAATVLVIEDDPNLRRTLEDNLCDEGYTVLAAANASAANRLWAQHAVDVVVLDIMLPDGSGYEVCRAIRRAGHPTRVLMLTARSLEEDLLAGFAAGADDYLTKPYRLRELLARVAALCRRGGVSPEVLHWGELRLDPAARQCTHVQTGPIELTRTEFDLLHTLAGHRDRALSREELLRTVWGEVRVDERTVDNFVSALKKKLAWTPSSPWRIRTVRGFGYRMEVDS